MSMRIAATVGFQVNVTVQANASEDASHAESPSQEFGCAMKAARQAEPDMGPTKGHVLHDEQTGPTSSEDASASTSTPTVALPPGWPPTMATEPQASIVLTALGQLTTDKQANTSDTASGSASTAQALPGLGYQQQPGLLAQQASQQAQVLNAPPAPTASIALPAQALASANSNAVSGATTKHADPHATRANQASSGSVMSALEGQPGEPAAAANATTSTGTNWASLMSDVGMRSSNASGHTTPVVTLPQRQAEQWREPLLNALGERVQWQIQRGSEQAAIRLEPPQLGRVDILIRQEGGQMQVHLSATHHEVAQQLQTISEGLRQELSLRQAADVQVRVSDSSTQAYQGQGQRQGQQDAPARQPGRALNESDESLSAAQRFSMQADMS